MADGKFVLMSRAGRWAFLALLAAFGLAAAYGMRADLPASRFATEEEQVYYAVKFGSGDLNPHYFLHPPLFAYVLCLLYGATFLIGRLAGWFHSAADFERVFFTDPTMFFMIARAFVLSLAVGGLFLVHRLAKRLYGRESIALMAAGFLGASVLYVTAAHYANTDIPMMVLALLALTMIVGVLQEGTMWRYAAAGLLIGLATATKYNAAWLVVALVLAHVIRHRDQRASWRQILGSRPLLLGVFLIGIGFLIGCPFALLDLRTFIASYKKLSWELMTPEYHFASYRAQGPGHLFILTSIFPGVMGVPLTVASVIGVAYACWRRQPSDLLLAGFLATIVGYLGTWHIIKPRYFIYAVPLLFILAARWCVAVADRWGSSARGRAGVLAVLWMLLVAASWRGVVRFDRLVAQTPVTTQARAWMERHVPSGTAVASFAGIPLVPNTVSIARQLEEIRARRLGQGIRLQRFSRYAQALPATYDVWPLPFPWREDFDESDFDFSRHRQHGVAYVLVTDEIAHYLADPSRYPVQVAYYNEVRRACRLVQSFQGTRPPVDPGLGDEEYVLIYEVTHG